LYLSTFLIISTSSIPRTVKQHSSSHPMRLFPRIGYFDDIYPFSSEYSAAMAFAMHFDIAIPCA
jgi:hypothetical protein